MSHKTINTEQGHWILAKVGKRVLRPGGRELSDKLIKGLDIQSTDDLVEFAPGMGRTACLLFDQNPHSYTGIELNEEAYRRLVDNYSAPKRSFVNASAADTALKSDSVDKLIGEAMLTMQADHRKAEIIKEAYRILKPGGWYAVHELGLMPDDIDQTVKKNIQRKLAKQMKVNARPLTKREWFSQLERQGFTIKEAFASPMHLLEPDRMIQDEGVLGAMKIGVNLLAHPELKKRVKGMRKTFRAYADQLTAFGIIVQK